jgi:carboxyl-terminal processing protease
MSRSLLAPVAALLVLGLACGSFAAPQKPAATPQDTATTYELLNLFGDVFDRVRSDYVEPVTDEKLIESALNGMLTSLDPHSSYMNEKSFAEMQVQTKGEFGGLGIEVTMDNGLVKVVSPIDDTPAAKAGLKPNDYISMIDDTPVMGLTLSEAVENMRGPVGSKVRLTVLREGEKKPLEKTLTRDTIKIQSVRSRREGDVAYIRVTSFAETTYDAMAEAIKKQQKDIGKNFKGVVLDLRNNPGGLLDQAIAVSDAFLEQGEIVSTRSRNPAESRRYDATSGDLIRGLPIVVLINEGSASASEIVAGALKDHKRAIVLGMKSFGKGSVQTVIPIKDHGAIRLTTARYYTPSGIAIQAKGITPDIMVEQAKLEQVKEGKTISEANLPKHLVNDQEKGEKGEDLKPGEISAKDDYQLSRALDLIRAVSIYGEVSTLKRGGATTTLRAAGME